MAKRILVIDDSAVTADLVTAALASAGYETAHAADLGQLDACLAERTFDLVLVDVNMPEMYGDDIVEFLRLQRQLRAKLVLYSDIDEGELAAKARQSGADGYIVKSAGLENAVDVVRKLLGTDVARSHRALVVESGTRVLERLRRGAPDLFAEIVSASTVSTATRALLKKASRPDVVLVDEAVEGVDPAELYRTIKGNTVFRGIRLVLVSEPRDESVRVAAEGWADLVLPLDDEFEERLAAFVDRPAPLATALPPGP